jgi:signal transduction histidine kinase
MHRMLGVLQPGEDEHELRPPPELSQLEELVERAGTGGMPVELEIEGERRPLPAGLELSAYRIVQEALTNVRRHAGDASATVVVRYEPFALAISVKDDGRGPGRGSPLGRGHGLIGIRERAALHGGEVHIGAREGGGFTVYARLPVDP